MHASHAGELSSACEACTCDAGSRTFFLSLECNRNCYFCFNPNQADYDKRRPLNANWKTELDEFFTSCDHVTHVALTGGEPLLHPRETVEFFRYAHEQQPQAHLRLYTSGDFLAEGTLAKLQQAGLSEIRISVKIDVDDASWEAVIDDAIVKIELAKQYVSDVMVEMPVIPGTAAPMKHLLRRMDEAGAFGINLLEFGYPMNRWDEFERRGFAVKNPPFPVTYDYGYAGGLPIDGSELLCLELLEFAIDEGLSLGVHYCSLENKNRSQVYQQNTRLSLDPALYELDGNDFFYKTAKVFDGDAPMAQKLFEQRGIPFSLDDEDGSLAFHPHHVDDLKGLPVVCALSCNIIDQSGGKLVIRELALKVIGEGKHGMEESVMDECETNDVEPWQERATAWELSALSFRYPDEVLAGAVASGEWADAACELADALGFELPEGFAEDARAATGEDHEALLHALRAEATRLFVGAPDPVCSPYEGVWRAADDGVQALLFVNPHSMDVERFCKSCGLGRPEGTNEPLDHAATECELLEHLSLRAAGLLAGSSEEPFVEPSEAPSAEGAASGEGAAESPVSSAEAAPSEALPVPGDLPGGSPEAAYRTFLDEHARTWMPRFAASVAEKSRHPFYRAAAALLAAAVG